MTSQRHYDKYKRDQKAKEFYRSTEWRTTRLLALERDNFECQECKRQGRVSKGQNVHHLKELKQRPDLALEVDNLETLCIKCHNDSHGKTFGSDKEKTWDDEWW